MGASSDFSIAEDHRPTGFDGKRVQLTGKKRKKKENKEIRELEREGGFLRSPDYHSKAKF